MLSPAHYTLQQTQSTLHTTHFTLHTTADSEHTTHYTLHTTADTEYTTHYTLQQTHYTLEQPRTVLAAPLSGHSKYNLLQENWGKVRPLCSSSSFVVLIGWLVVVIPLLPVLAVL